MNTAVDTGEGAWLRPRGSRLLVKKDEGDGVLSSGLYIPEEARERPTSGVVLSVGEEQREFSAGSRVIFGQYSGLPLQTKAGTYYILEDEEVLGSVHDPS